jgi:hypothetical protein
VVGFKLQKLFFPQKFVLCVFFTACFFLTFPSLSFSQEASSDEDPQTVATEDVSVAESGGGPLTPEAEKGGDSTVLRLLNRFALSDETYEINWEDEDKQTNAITTVKPQKNKLVSGIVATGETFIVNLLIWSGARFISKDSWAYLTWSATKENMHWSSWEWEKGDSDVFSINQLWHPYAGTAYHEAARANGFGFYESVLFDAFGSYSWETFAENMHPSTNDFIATVAGGAIMGEVLHRLFVELYTAYPVLGATLGVGVSESEWVHGFLFRQGVRERSRNTIYEFSLTSGFCWSAAQFYAQNTLIKTWREPGGAFDLRLAYGNPFQQRSTIPFNHFELTFGLNGARYYDLTIITDAYLFSFMPIDETSSQGTTGLTLHFNYYNITNSTDPVNLNVGYENINFSDFSLDWSFKYRHYFNPDFYWTAKTHGGFSGIAFSNSNDYKNPTSHADYLIGGNIKLLLSLSHTRWGTLRADSMVFETGSINGISMSEGSLFFGYFDFSYSYPFTKALSLVIANSVYYLNGQFENISDIERWFNNTRVGVAITF